jgi:hypothetical protein
VFYGSNKRSCFWGQDASFIVFLLIFFCLH